MGFDPDLHHRRSIRLRDYNYAEAGAYFVTICVQGREDLFGEVVDGVVMLSDAGRSVETAWRRLPKRFPSVETDEFVLMPNHLHGIIVIAGSVGTMHNHASTLGKIVRAFKSISAIEVNRILDRHERPLWQRNYYERVVRDEHEMSAICEYIRNNPSQWAEDDENPGHS